MNSLTLGRLGLVLLLATLIAPLSVAVTRGNLAGAIWAIAENRSTQEQPQAPAQASGYDLSWWTVDGGGRTGGSETHPYALGGTAGQPDAAVWTSNGYTLAGGFWGGVAIEYRVFLPLVLRDT